MNENASRALAYAASATQLAARAALDALRLTNDPAAWALGGRRLLGRPRRRTGRPRPWRRTDCRLHRRGGRRPCRPRRKRRARNPPLTRERSVSP